jgi:hypothetical protein
LTKQHEIASGGGRLPWKVHATALLKEIAINANMSALKIPLNIFKDMLAEVATRASVMGDERMDDLMMRLALYEQGDPYSEAHDPDFVAKANESRVKVLHGREPKSTDGDHAGNLARVREAEIERAIGLARTDVHEWSDPKGRIRRHDWREHVGEAVQRQWPHIPFATRVAIILDAEAAAGREEYE